jgi:hypothetical protein
MAIRLHCDRAGCDNSAALDIHGKCSYLAMSRYHRDEELGRYCSWECLYAVATKAVEVERVQLSENKRFHDALMATLDRKPSVGAE